jgi:hypothetical protein
MFEVKVDLSPALSRLIGQPAARVRRAGSLAATRAAEEYSDAIHEWVQDGKAYKVGQNTTMQATGWHPQGDGAVVYSNGPHAGYIEFDTRAHLIKPKPGRKALRWFAGGPGGGRMIRRSVRHPGTKAQPFFFVDQEARGTRMLGVAREAVAEVLGAGDA